MTHKEQILRLKEQGKTYREIRDIVGCSLGTIAYHIGIGQRTKTQTNTRERRNAIVKFIQEYKSNKPCVDCKEVYPYWVMDFDHLRDKKFNIGQFRTTCQSLEVVKAEIAKCDLVCANCHRTRTWSRRLKSSADAGLEYCSHFE